MKSAHSSYSLTALQPDNTLTWNVTPLLHQIRHALKRLLDENISDIIDCQSIPLAPGELDRLLELLGQGEVRVELVTLDNSLGKSDIFETRFAGVWLVTHYNDEAEITSRHIEITHMPSILLSQPQDMQSALDNIHQLLSEDANESTATENGS